MGRYFGADDAHGVGTRTTASLCRADVPCEVKSWTPSLLLLAFLRLRLVPGG